jgi:hypothetical protein
LLIGQLIQGRVLDVKFLRQNCRNNLQVFDRLLDAHDPDHTLAVLGKVGLELLHKVVLEPVA